MDSKRLERIEKIEKELKKVVSRLKFQGRCVERNFKFENFFKDISFVGNGFSAQVHSAKLNGQTIILKETILKKKEIREILAGIPTMEQRISFFTNNFIKKNLCPNFAFHFGSSFCEVCFIKVNSNEKQRFQRKGTCVLHYLEHGDENLRNYLNEEAFDFCFQLSVIFQLTLAVCSIQKLNVIHRDINPDNILVKLDPSLKGTLIKYIFEGEEFLIPHEGVTILLIDFGEAKDVSNGERNSPDDEESTEDEDSVFWSDGRVTKRGGHDKSIAPIEFACDIFGIIETFLGFDRENEKKVDERVKLNLKNFQESWPVINFKLKKFLKNEKEFLKKALVSDSNGNFYWEQDTTENFFAINFLHRIYKKFCFYQKRKISRTFEFD